MENIHNGSSPIMPKPTLLKKRTPTPTFPLSQPRRPVNPFASTSTTPQSMKRNLRAFDLQTVKEYDIERNAKRKLLDEIPLESNKEEPILHKAKKFIKVAENEIEEVDSQPKHFTKLNGKLIN